MLLLLLGCYQLDGFFFAGVPVDSYVLGYDVIPEANVEEVTFGDNDLAGVWAHQDTPNAPVLIYFHGNAENIDGYWESVEDYWSWGYETFIFDYQGFGKSKGPSSFDNVIADGAAASNYVSETTGLASGDIIYLGLSLGGFSSINTSVSLPPKVLITESMFASADHLSDVSLGLDTPSGWFFRDPFDNVATAAQVHVPYLIMHGEADDFIEVSNSDEVFAAANEPKLLWQVPGANHTTIPQTDPEGYKSHIMCWSGVGSDCAAELMP